MKYRGKIYQFYCDASSKAEAQKVADRLRKEGWSAIAYLDTKKEHPRWWFPEGYNSIWRVYRRRPDGYKAPGILARIARGR